MFRVLEDKYNRVGRFEITENGKVIYSSAGEEGLDFKFSFTTTASDIRGSVGTGSVGVLGLQGETIRRLVDFGPVEVAYKKQRFVTVYAGYESDPHAEDVALFSMPIVSALVTSPPDMWLNFQVWTDAYERMGTTKKDQEEAELTENERRLKEAADRMKQIEDSHDRKNLRYLALMLCNYFNIKLCWEISEEDTQRIPVMDWPVMNGDVDQLPIFFNKLGWVRARFEYKYQTIYEKNFHVKGEPKELHLTLNAEYVQRKDTRAQISIYDKKAAEADTRVITKDNGMIGLPQFQPLEGKVTLKVKTLLRRDIKIGDYIAVKSSMFNIEDGSYFQVNEISYEGQFRGNSWYTNYTAVAVSRPKLDKEDEDDLKVLQEK